MLFLQLSSSSKGNSSAMARKACVLGLSILGLCASLTFVAPTPPVQNSKNGVGVPESIRGRRPLIMPQDARQFVPPSSETGSFSWFCRLSAAAACAVIASAAKQQRAEKIVVRIFPSRCMSRQKTMRRLEPFGEMPAWSRKPLLRRRLKQPWRKRPIRRLSPYGRYLYERSRLRVHYNINVRQLTKYVLRAFKEGRKHPIDHLMAILESRIDNFCWRVGIAPTMAGARFMVRENHIQIKSKRQSYDYKEPEWVTVNMPSHLLKIGDQIRVRPKPRSQKLAQRYQEEDGEVDVPDHLEWNRDELVGKYNDLCDPNQVGITVNEDFLISKFLGPQGVKQRHVRWFEGTTIPIDKIYNGGRIRPTPENILNMKRGFGLRARGYRRPPCLWGRKTNPLNDPWEYGSKVKVWEPLAASNFSPKDWEKGVWFCSLLFAFDAFASSIYICWVRCTCIFRILPNGSCSCNRLMVANFEWDSEFGLWRNRPPKQTPATSGLGTLFWDSHSFRLYIYSRFRHFT